MPRPVKGSRAVLNGVRRLAGVDGRTRAARTFRDLVKSFGADLGGLERLSEPEVALVRQAAAVALRAEQMQAEIARGEDVSGDELIRLSSEVRRLLGAIRRHDAPKKPSLADHLAKRGVAA